MRTSLSYAVIGLAGVFLAVLAACQTEQPAPQGAKVEAAPSDGAQQKEKADDAEADQAPPSEETPDSEQPEHKPNRLAKETSPYLLMHAHNPVDWFPWGEEAFAKAQREKKAIFLSIGYSSCYWCHVMERESFMDEEIARFLNDNFVCIKVDREERPDVDDIYMTSVQLMTQRGGWPLSAFLTSDAKPFFGGTYFPARTGDRPGGGVGFLELVNHVHKLWNEKPELIREQADKVADVLKEALREQQQTEPVDLKAELLDTVQESLATQFDPDYGGFGYSPSQPQRPKFPTPPDLMFLVERARKGDEKAMQMLTLTLEKMAEGGIRDHLGGGFHRYSTDRFWRIPHFEKMLYDNGQLATVYAEAYALKPRDDFRQVLVEMLDFVLREMTDESGAFYSAIDAETDAEEGKFYRWEQQELESLLEDEQFKLMGSVYGFTGAANFEDEYFVPLMDRPYRQIAKDLDRDPAELEKQLAPLRAQLLAARDKRERPLTDTKVLTAWNGLMIRGFADAGRILTEDRYTQAAVRAADFVLDKLKTDDGRLLRTYREGSAKLNAYIDDYAFLVEGLIALHRATGDQRWLDAADALTAKQIELFWDDEGDGFYFTSGDHETLIARAKKRTDSVLPSANSVAAENLVYLSIALNKPEYLERARKTIAAFGGSLGNVDEARHMPRLATALAALLVAEAPADGPKAESD